MMDPRFLKVVIVLSLFVATKPHNSPKFKPDNIPDYKFSKFLDKEHTFFMQWMANTTHAIIEVQVKTLGWVGIGLSPHGGMHEADIVVAWINFGHIFVEDRYATGNSEPLKDYQQDWTALYGRENETHTIIGLTRLLDTCDIKHDRVITKDTLHFIYAYHSKDIINGVMPQHEVRGTINLFFYAPIPEFVIPDYTKKLQFRMSEYHVEENKETEYMCRVMPIRGIDKKYHIIATGPLKTPGNEPLLHHIDLYLCSPNFYIPAEQFICRDPAKVEIKDKCFHSVLVAWSLGAEGFIYPDDIGKPLESNMENRMVLLEIHYNNPYKLKGHIDSSGIEIYLTDKLRNKEAGEIILGFLEYSWNMLIPPKQKNFRIVNECSALCTSQAFPVTGINIFSYILHTHQTGIRLRVRIIRDGKELKPIIFDDHFKFDYQAKRRLSTPIKVFPADILLAECDYSTVGYENYIVGGESSSDEMCIILLSYYPKSLLYSCGSIVSKNLIASTIGFGPLNGTVPRVMIENFLNQEEKKVNQLPEIASELQNIYNNGSVTKICTYANENAALDGEIMHYKPYPEKSSKCHIQKEKTEFKEPSVQASSQNSKNSAVNMLDYSNIIFPLIASLYVI